MIDALPATPFAQAGSGPDLSDVLADIPAEYRDKFQQTLAAEQAEASLTTEADVLAFLRQRRGDFRRGAYIRPDGRQATLEVDRATAYERALPELVRQQRAAATAVAERRRAVIVVALLVAGLLAVVLVAYRGRANREAAQVAATAEARADLTDGTPAPIPDLPDVAGADQALETIGGLGGALTLGRPSALALSFSAGETIALAIDPSRPTPRGELRYNAAVMVSENPVAVWLFGTVLNYAIGIPESLVRNLAAGDAILLSTDTGAALRFVVTETGTAANYDTGRLLSQDRIGLTLFALPAPAADAVAYALADYDPTAAAADLTPVPGLGEGVTLGAGELTIDAVNAQPVDEEYIRIVITGTTTTPDSTTLALQAGPEQTPAQTLTPAGDGSWTASFLLPAAAAGRPLTAQLATAPAGRAGGATAAVDLGPVPDAWGSLALTLATATWDGTLGQAVLTFTVTNPTAGAVFLPADFIQFPPRQGGDIDSPSWQSVPRLPAMISPGETLGLTVAFYPTDTSVSVQVQAGAELWAIWLPAAQSPAAAGMND